MNLKETYNKIAKNWHKDHEKDDWWVCGADVFISLLKPGNLVLDVGCGSGTKSKYLTEHGLRVFGIDIAEKMIEIAKKEVPTGTFSVLDLDEASTLIDVFDGILAQAVLLHIPQKEVEKRIKKLAQKLKSGGYFYVAVKEREPNGPEEEVRIEKDYGYVYERFFSYFTIDEMRRYLQNAGCKIVFEKITPTGGSTRWIQMIGQKQWST